MAQKNNLPRFGLLVWPCSFLLVISLLSSVSATRVDVDDLFDGGHNQPNRQGLLEWGMDWNWEPWRMIRELVSRNYDELMSGNGMTWPWDWDRNSRLGLIPYVRPTPTLTSTLGNALGVLGLGFLITKEFAVALNTPILIPFMLVIFFVMFVAAAFFPNVGSLIGI